MFAAFDTPSVVISPQTIARSDYNLAHLGPASLRPYKGLSGLFSSIAKILKQARAPTTIYAYWPDLDAIGHEHGIESPQALAHLNAIERELSKLQKRLAGSDSMLLVSADHGQLDTDPARITELSASRAGRLSAHPALR